MKIFSFSLFVVLFTTISFGVAIIDAFAVDIIMEPEMGEFGCQEKPEIYEHVCDQISSQNILFIDDKQENLDVAKLFDMETILFTSDDYESGLIEEKILNFLN